MKNLCDVGPVEVKGVGRINREIKRETKDGERRRGKRETKESLIIISIM